MATITIDVPNAQANRVMDAIASTYGWSATLPDPNNPGATIPNPQTKAQFVKATLAGLVRSIVVAHEADQAAAASRANTDVNVT